MPLLQFISSHEVRALNHNHRICRHVGVFIPVLHLFLNTSECSEGRDWRLRTDLINYARDCTVSASSRNDMNFVIAAVLRTRTDMQALLELKTGQPHVYMCCVLA